MRITLALLADHVLAHPDGKLYVTGGGIRSLAFPAFPATYGHLALGLGIELDREDLGSEHSVLVEGRGPGDTSIVRPVSARFRVTADSPDGLGYFHFVANMDNVSLPNEGDYSFIVSIDGTQLGSVSLRASLGPRSGGDVDALAALEAQALVNAGYVAFERGDVAGAERSFRAAVARSPSLSTAHNNLGFALLSKGEAQGALNAFAEAKRLGYPQNEISDANLGSAMYIAGDYDAALQVFTDCLKTHVFRGPAVLFAIGSEGLFPVHLASAADYAVLIALNAAWSARRIGDHETMSRYLEVARAGRGIGGESSDARLRQAIHDAGGEEAGANPSATG